MSLVKKNIAKALAAKSGQTASTSKAPESTATSSAKTVIATPSNDDQARDQIMKDFDMYKIGIESDLAQLKTFSELEKKHQYKREALANNGYLEYIEEYQKCGANHPNIVLAWVFVWLVDLQRWNKVLELLPLMAEQQQPLPTKFNTKHWGTFVIDQLYDVGAATLEKAPKYNELFDIIRPFYVLIDLCEKNKWDVNDIVKGKLYAMTGKLEHLRFNFGNALHHYVSATQINDKAGVKKVAKDLAKQLNIEIEI